VTKSPYLVDVLSEQARLDTPVYEKTIVLDGRTLSIRVHEGDHCVVFHLAGARGGFGEMIVVPMGDVIDVAQFALNEGYIPQLPLWEFPHNQT